MTLTLIPIEAAPEPQRTPLHAVGDRVVVRLVGTVLLVRQTSGGPIYVLGFEDVDGDRAGLAVPAHAISATEG